MFNYIILFLVILFCTGFTTKIINYFNIEDKFLNRILIFCLIYYLTLIPLNYFFFKNNKNETIQEKNLTSGSSILIEKKEEYLSPIINEIYIEKNLNEYNSKKTIVNLNNLNLIFDEQSGSPIFYKYFQNNKPEFEMFNFENEYLKPFSISAEFETPNEFYLYENFEDENNIILNYISDKNKKIKIEKKYIIDKKLLKIKCLFKINTDKETSIRLFLPQFKSLKENEEIQNFIYNDKNEYETIDKKNYDKLIFIKPKIIGFKDSFFINSIIQNSSFKRGYFSKNNESEKYKDMLVLETENFIVEKKFEIDWYFGPKKYDTLKKIDEKLVEFTEYGYFSIFIRFSIYCLNLIFDFVKNYGIAIFLFSLILKLITFPLAYYSKDSNKLREEFMRKNKYVQEKYKNDPVRRSQEQMELIKKYGIMPGGLSYLGNIIQLPFIISLQRIFKTSIDFYEVPFFKGWINNISLPDPYMILPAIFAFFIYTQLLKTADTIMKNVGFLILSLVLFFIFSKFSAAMLLFFLANTIFTQIQSKLFNLK